MNAEIVYQVVKALPKEEQQLLFEKLKVDLFVADKFKKHKNKPLLSYDDALQYLLKNVFSKERY